MSTPKKIESNRQVNDFDSKSDAPSRTVTTGATEVSQGCTGETDSRRPPATLPSDPPEKDKRNTVEAINDFLKQNSSGHPAARQCGECGSPMQYIDAYFWLDGADLASVIPLPFCPICQPDVLTALRRKGGQGCFDMDKAS
jgi:hypothetical protein